MNKRAKGKRAEKLFEKYLQKQGYITWKPTNCKFGNNDLFRVFDIIAIKDGRIHLFQIKSGTIYNFYSAKKRIKQFLAKFDKILFSASVVFVGKGKCRIDTYQDKNYFKQIIDCGDKK